jgi:hypothetical protein
MVCDPSCYPPYCKNIAQFAFITALTKGRSKNNLQCLKNSGMQAKAASTNNQ